jgi:hypothetical protein
MKGTTSTAPRPASGKPDKAQTYFRQIETNKDGGRAGTYLWRAASITEFRNNSY